MEITNWSSPHVKQKPVVDCTIKMAFSSSIIEFSQIMFAFGIRQNTKRWSKLWLLCPSGRVFH